MPKINVYLPDDLAHAVRAASIPVSAVCQRALEDAVRHAAAAAESTRALEDAGEADLPLRGVFTGRLRDSVKLAYAAAREREVNFVGTEHLLLGVLDQRSNLAVRVIEALEVSPDDVRSELEGVMAQQPGASRERSATPAMTPLARRTFELAAEESTRFGHNYVGCEHLLLGLIVEEDGLAGRVLRSMGLEKTAVRRAVVTALTGIVHARHVAQSAATTSTEGVLREIQRRLDAIERKLGA
jgi:ATP-dependent Clp protease ATP-binding subunit ClpC